ncbi:MAG TPA: DUF5939 domain-containing protein [Gammaproteobacteria bacterium]
MTGRTDTGPLFAQLASAAAPAVVDAIAALVRDGSDRELCRVNALAFATARDLPQDAVIAGFLHAARLGLFEMTWGLLCPGCGGVLNSGSTLRTVDRARYSCALCAGHYEPTLDEMVEVTFTVAPAVRGIEAHAPDTLPLPRYLRQVLWGSGMDLPDEAGIARVLDEIVLTAAELPAGAQGVLELALPAEFVILFDPVSHAAQFIDVQGAPTAETREVVFVLEQGEALNPTLQLPPGPLRVRVDNRTATRTLPSAWVAGDLLHEVLGRRRPFLTAKRLLSNQTFRDLYRNDTLDIDQRLKITSLTFLFTDLKGSTELYERVGDLVAYDVVRAHFRILQEIIASESGAIVKTIGDAVMATFPTPGQGLAAALRMRDALQELDRDMLLKIGLHEGPCLAVVLNDQQDYFGQTVNIAARVQQLAASRAIFVTEPVLSDATATALLQASGIAPEAREQALRGVRHAVRVYEIP